MAREIAGETILVPVRNRVGDLDSDGARPHALSGALERTRAAGVALNRDDLAAPTHQRRQVRRLGAWRRAQIERRHLFSQNFFYFLADFSHKVLA